MKIAVVGALPPAWLFPILYHSRARWWANSGGLLIMNMSVSVAIFYTISAIVITTGASDPELAYVLGWAQLVGALWLGWAVWYQLILFCRSLKDHDEAS